MAIALSARQPGLPLAVVMMILKVPARMVGVFAGDARNRRSAAIRGASGGAHHGQHRCETTSMLK
jgi:hypothetical protein